MSVITSNANPNRCNRMSIPTTQNKKAKIASWLFQVIAALILLQTLFFKFTGAEMAVHIFTTLGVEPWGRIATGIFELAAGALLLLPFVPWLGAALAVALMVGAIGSHLFTPLGIVVQGDPSLFVMAWIVLAAGLVVLVLRRHQIPLLRERLMPAPASGA